MADKDQVTHLRVDELQPNPFQPRGKMNSEEISELMQSIRTYGILEPIVVAQTPAGVQIVAGERRWRAARELGMEEVPVIIKKTTPKGMLEMAIVENIQRVDLSALERASALQQLIRDFGYSQQEVADKLGKSVSFVSNTLRLLALPDAIKDGMMGGLITEGHARALSGLRDERAMVDCYKVILKESASVRRAEELVRRFKDKVGQQDDGRGRGVRIQNPHVEEWIKSLEKTFPEKTDVKFAQSARQTKVTLTFFGKPEQVQRSID